MKIGYPCINRSIDCKSDHTFRLKSYSEKRLTATIEDNLVCLKRILHFNIQKELYFFRITSDLVPFASHPINTYDWQHHFARGLKDTGLLIRKYNIRISMHPDPFTLINSLDLDVFRRSVAELDYHAQVLDLMELDSTAKIQIHVGGVYGNKEKSMERFIARSHTLDRRIRNRLVIENDERNYTVRDCLEIHHDTGIPVLFDAFHHAANNNGEDIKTCLKETGRTWRAHDGILMVDYSLQKKGAMKGAHAETIRPKEFWKFLEESKPYDFDIMLEIKDKEKSALKAARIARHDIRFLP